MMGRHRTVKIARCSNPSFHMAPARQFRFGAQTKLEFKPSVQADGSSFVDAAGQEHAEGMGLGRAGFATRERGGESNGGRSGIATTTEGLLNAYPKGKPRLRSAESAFESIPIGECAGARENKTVRVGPAPLLHESFPTPEVLQSFHRSHPVIPTSRQNAICS